MNEKKDVTEINIIKLIESLVKKWWLIAIATIVGAAMALGYTIGFVTPQYKASVMLYVNNSTVSIGSVKASISSGEISTARTLVETYIVILKTRLTLETVAERISETGTEISYNTLKQSISASAVNGTEVLQVTVTHSSPEMAMTIANTIAEVLPEKISEIIVGCSVKTVDFAVMPTAKSSPSYSRNTVIGAVLGALLCCCVIVLVEIFSNTVTEEDWLLDQFNKEIPILATIPNTSSARRNRGYGYKKYGYGAYATNNYETNTQYNDKVSK